MRIKGLLPAWAGLLSFSVVSSGAQYLSLLFPTWAIPLWLWPIALLSALQSAYYATYYLNRRTPFLVRLIELAFWLVPTYFLSGRVIQVFLWNALLVILSWLIARGYGSHFVFMERVADYLGDQGASTVSWEYESLASTDSHYVPMKYFWWRLWGFALVLAVLAIAVHHRNVNLGGMLLLRLRLLGTLTVVSGLALQAGAYLFRLQILWGYARADVSPNLRRQWLRSLRLVLLLVVLVVNLAPIDYWPLTAQRIGEIVRQLQMEGPTFDLPPLGGPEATPRFEEQPDMVFPQEAATGPWGIILALFTFLLLIGLAVVILLVLGFVLVQLIGGEIDRLKGLPRLAVQVYEGLRNAIRILIRELGNLKANVQAKRPRLAGSGETAAKRGGVRKAAALPKGVRAMLRRIAKVGAKKGLVFHPAQTASEYGQILQQRLPNAQNRVEDFFSGYQKVRYSGQELSSLEQGSLLEIGAQIVEEIDGLERGD